MIGSSREANPRDSGAAFRRLTEKVEILWGDRGVPSRDAAVRRGDLLGTTSAGGGSPGFSSGASWGGIGGTITDQADLVAGFQAKLVSATNLKTVNGTTLLGSGNLVVTAGESFETVSKNLLALDATLTYSGGQLVLITYAGGISKTLAYGVDGLASVTLAGAVPGGIDLTKTFAYSGGDLVGWTYS